MWITELLLGSPKPVKIPCETLWNTVQNAERLLWPQRHVKHPVKICVKYRCCYGNTNKSLLSLIKIERESLEIYHNNLAIQLKPYCFGIAFSPICIVNENFSLFIFLKTLADKLSTWFLFHSCHLFLFNVRHFTKIRSCRKRNRRFETALIENAMIHEPIVGSSSGFPLLNQLQSANSHTWLLSCWHNKGSLFIHSPLAPLVWISLPYFSALQIVLWTAEYIFLSR